MDDSPFTPRIAGLQRMFWYEEGPDPTHFLGRIIVYSIPAAFVALMAIARLSLYAVELRRVHQPFWLSRFVSQPSGTFFVLNQRVWGPVTGLITSGTMLAYFIGLYRIFGLGESRRAVTGLANTAHAMLSLNGLMVGWSTLQGTLVVLESKGKQWAAAVSKASLCIFFGSMTIIASHFIIMPVLGSRAWYNLIDEYEIARAGLLAAQAAFNGTRDPAAIAFVDGQIATLRMHSSESNKAEHGVVVIFAISAITKALLGATGLVVYSVVRRQLVESHERSPDRPLNSSAIEEGAPGVEVELRLDPIDDDHSPTKETFAGLCPPSLALGSRASSDPTQHQQRLKDLHHAKSQVGVLSFNTVITGLIFGGIFCWVTTIPFLHLRGTHWHTREIAFCLVGVLWGWLMAPTSFMLVLNDWRHMPDKEGQVKVLPAEDDMDAFFARVARSNSRGLYEQRAESHAAN